MLEHENQTVRIRFEGISLAEANVKAARLREEILNSSDDVSVMLEKDDPLNQDFGATLVLVLGTPAAIAVARGIASYLQRDHASITIEADGTVVAKGVSGDDAARIAEAVSRKK
jgi:hypothetical protein